jgi:LysM repeat protein/ABC-type branched-subunit amino acid transport system substrate-binding protein
MNFIPGFGQPRKLEIPMRKYVKITLSVIVLILMSLSGSAQVQSTINRSAVIEQYKGKPYYIHFVKAGETLTDIARAYDVSPELITAENPEAQQRVYVNQVLKIPVTIPASDKTIKPVSATTVTTTTESAHPAKGDVSEKEKASQSRVNAESSANAIDAPVKAPVVTPVKAVSEKPEAPDVQAAVQKQKVTYTQYTVKKKETLYGIAKKFGVEMGDIIDANPGLKIIENGMILRIPKKMEGENKPVTEQKAKNTESFPLSNPSVKPGNEKTPVKLETYVVKAKETLYSIAKAHNISIESLIELNPELADGLKAGLIIKVPVQGGTAEPGPVKESGIRPIQSPEVQSAGTGAGSPCSAISWQEKIYKVALMLPFDLAKSDSLLATDISQLKHAGAYKPFNFIEIYEGALLALDSLEQTGAHVKFFVYDCDGGNDTTKTRRILLKPELEDMDLIIGPVFARSAATAARFAAKNGIAIVNPLSRRAEILKGNTNIFKVQPSDAAVAEKLATFIVHQHPDANVLIVRNTRTDDPDLAKYLPQKIKYQLQQAGRSASVIPVYDIIYQNELFGGVSKHLSTTKENMVIVLSNNSVFIPDFISRLNNLHKSHHIILVGSPEWKKLDPETDYLVKLNYHQYSFSWIDHTSPVTKNFRKKFQNRFSTEPEDDKYAFLGYDMTFFFVKALLDYGHDFGPCIANQPDNSGAPFDFRKPGLKDGYENIHLNILKIEDYHWVDAEK